MAHRFHVPELSDLGEVVLHGPEAHHLRNVLRLGPGQTVQLFDGTGREAMAEVVSLKKKRVELQIRDCWVTPEPASRVSLATAVPKGERFRWLVEKATELGVQRLIPLQTARSVVLPRPNKLEKMQQTVLAASKQSGRSRLMSIEPLRNWATFLADELPQRPAWLAHPRGEAVSRAVSASRHGDILLCIGPEGGFTEEEISQATAAGAELVRLGGLTLRTETAAVALAASLLLE